MRLLKVSWYVPHSQGIGQKMLKTQGHKLVLLGTQINVNINLFVLQSKHYLMETIMTSLNVFCEYPECTHKKYTRIYSKFITDTDEERWSLTEPIQDVDSVAVSRLRHSPKQRTDCCATRKEIFVAAFQVHFPSLQRFGLRRMTFSPVLEKDFLEPDPTLGEPKGLHCPCPHCWTLGAHSSHSDGLPAGEGPTPLLPLFWWEY